MKKYVDSVGNLGEEKTTISTDTETDNAVVVNTGSPVIETSAGSQSQGQQENIFDPVSYSAPRKVIVRRFILRK